jgi:hypothetical protein
MTEQAIEQTPVQKVEEYIKLRDTKKAAEDRFSEWEKEAYGNRMNQLEMELLDILNQLGADNLSGPSGTVHKIHKTSVTVADAASFRRHVIGEEAWELIDWRANKTAINEMVEAGDGVPPGINRTTHITVGIRKK